MPASSRLRSASSPTLGMSRVISSGPSLVSRAATSNSSMWIEVKTSSLTMRSEIRIEFLVVVAVPGHEGDEHVLAQSQLAQIGARPVGDELALDDHVAHLHQRALVDAGVLVRALELAQLVDVDPGIARCQVVGDTHHDAHRVDLVDHAGALRGMRRARIARHDLLDAGADERRLGAEQRHGLALHVRAHQCAVRVIVFEERDQRGGDGHELLQAKRRSGRRWPAGSA